MAGQRSKAHSIEDLLDEIKGELDAATKRKDNAQAKFILRSDLEAIWTKHSRLKKFFSRSEWGKQHWLEIRDRLLRVVSILVYIKWNKWDTFKDTFFHHKDAYGKHDRLDDHLPFASLSKLEEPSFLGVYGQNFHADQYVFLPVTIEQGEVHRWSKERRLPFLESHWLGEGASANVYKETIARCYFKVKEETNQKASNIFVAHY